MSTFYGGIISYDVHTYYNKGDKEEKEFALALREKVLVEFADLIEKGDVRVHKVWEDPIGPHPIVMWELDFSTQEAFVRILPWFQINHGKLSVLIHPRSDKGDRIDHTDHALWLGHKQRLITKYLD